MRLVFMGTPAFAVPTLKALHAAGHDIAGVYTQPPRPAGRGQKESPSPVHQYALDHKLPVFTPASLKKPDVQKIFAGHKADAAVVVAYGLILPKPILEAYPLGCINVHPSLLPRWRGAAPLQRTIMAGDRETAIVIMQMDEGLDTGDMLLTKKYPIAEGMTAGALHDMLAEKAAPLALEALQNIKTIKPVKQPGEGVTYANKISKDEARIDWSKPAEQLYYHVLGLSPFPGAYFTYKGENIKVLDASYESRETGAKPGAVVDNHLGIACNPGILRPTMLQRPGKKRMSAGELLRGHPIPLGSMVE